VPVKNQSTHYHRTVLEVRKLYNEGFNVSQISYKCTLNPQTVKKWIENLEFVGVLTHEERLNLWLENKIEFRSLRNWMIEYLLKEVENKCSSCGWAKLNARSGKSPLETDHIDGNRENNYYSNLRLLCPNCHGLTPTFQSLNKEETQYILQNNLKDRATEMFEQGDLSLSEISNKIGISTGTIKYHLMVKQNSYRDELGILVQKWTTGECYRAANLHPWIRFYLLEQANFSCTWCGDSQKNPVSDGYILQVDHIDGDSTNQCPQNLRVLCYNCHSLTETYKAIGDKYLKGQEVRRIKDKERKLQKRGDIPVKKKILNKYSEQEIFDAVLEANMNLAVVASKIGVYPASVRVKLNKNEPIKEKIAEIRENNKSKPSLKKVYPSSKLLEILEEPGMNLLSLEKRVGYSRGAITARLKRDGCFEKAIQVIEANKVKLGQKCKYSSSEIIDLLMKEGVTLKEFAKTLGWSTSHLNRKLKRSGYFIKDISKQVTNNNLTLDIELKEKDK